MDRGRANRTWSAGGAVLAAALAFVVLLVAAPPGARAQDLSACRQTRDLPRAITACTNIIERRGATPASRETISYAHHLRAHARSQSNDLAGAIADYTAAIAINDKDTAAYLGRAALYLQSRQWTEAARDYRKEIELRPRYGPAHAGLGQALLELGQTQEALNELDSALRLTPSDRTAVAARARALAQLGRNAEAIAALEQALRNAPNDPQLRQALAAIPRPEVRTAARDTSPPPGAAPTNPSRPTNSGGGLPPLVAPLPPSLPPQALARDPDPAPAGGPSNVQRLDGPLVVPPLAPELRNPGPPPGLRPDGGTRVASRETGSTPVAPEIVAPAAPATPAVSSTPFYCEMVNTWAAHAAKYTGVQLHNIGCR